MSNYIPVNGCTCISPEMGHGMSNNLPCCGCWPSHNKNCKDPRPSFFEELLKVKK